MSALTLNIDTITYFSSKRSMKQLHGYAIASYIMRGLGYMRKDIFLARAQEQANISDKSAYRWLKSLKTNYLVKEVDGMLYICGKKAVDRTLGSRSRTHIKFQTSELLDYKQFKNHCIRQLGLIYQNRFKFNHSKIVKNVNCPLMVERIEFPISNNKHKVGVSLSYISKKTGLSQSCIASALAGHTKTNEEFLRLISWDELVRLTSWGYFKEQYRIRYKRYGGRLGLYYRLSNSVVCPAATCRR